MMTIGRQHGFIFLVIGSLGGMLEPISAAITPPLPLAVTAAHVSLVKKKNWLPTRLAFMNVRGGSSSSPSDRTDREQDDDDADEFQDWKKDQVVVEDDEGGQDEDLDEEDDEDGDGGGTVFDADDEGILYESSLDVTAEEADKGEVEADVSVEAEVSVEVSETVAEEEEDLEGELDDDDVGVTFQEEIIEVIEHSTNSEENDVRFMATTTDGELADDEGMDLCISAPEDVLDLAGVSAGGAVAAIDEEDNDDDEGVAVEEAELEGATMEVEEIVQISDEMKEVLRKELHYTTRDVLLMRPEIASMVVYHRLIRPIEGMPINWYIEGAGPPSAVRRNAIKIALTTAVLGAVAVLSLKGGDALGIDVSDIADRLKKIPAALAGIPKAALSALKAVKGEAVKTLPAGSSTEIAPEASHSFSEKEEEEIVDEVVHSLKPGAKTGPKLDEDKSVLDKFLTAIESAIKGFFRIKI